MEIEILSLFPEYFLGPFNESILKRAREKGLLTIRHTQIRDFAWDKHRKVDDRPYGGGPGMVLKPEPVVRAIRSVRKPNSHVIFLSPRGKLLTAEKCRSLSKEPHLILLCGHYEGVDERAIDQEVNEEISIGDYVLTNGALAAIVLIDAMSRFIPGVLGDPEAADQDSFEQGLLDCPHYTRPEVFEEKKVPDVLLSGNHHMIANWRKEMAIQKTLQQRPDLYQRCFGATMNHLSE
jgi:tRNA (guanine37-N1)-methyltransferase